MESTKEITQKVSRNYKIEIIRIIAMFMIVMTHVEFHGFANIVDRPFCLNTLFLDFIKPFGQYGNSLFIMISGYFLCSSTRKKISVIKIITQVWFYSWSIALIFLVLKLPILSEGLRDSAFSDNITFTTLNIKDLVLSACPLLFWDRSNWFVTIYLILYLLIPYLNTVINSLSKNQMKKLLIILYSVSFLINSLGFIANPANSTIDTFIILYFTGAYLRLHWNCDHTKAHRLIIFSVLLFIILSLLWIIPTYIIRYGIIKIDSLQTLLSNHPSMFYSRVMGLEVLPMIFSSILLFMGFISWSHNIEVNKFKSERYCHIIEIVSSTTFGIYLIHENRLIRNSMYFTFLKVGDYFTNRYLPLLFIVYCLLLFLICSIIEYIRKNTIERFILSLFLKK